MRVSLRPDFRGGSFLPKTKERVIQSVYFFKGTAMPEFLQEHFRLLPLELQLGSILLYLTIGFFVAAKLHGILWRFAEEHPPTPDAPPVTRMLKTSLARWAGLMIGFFFWFLVPFMAGGGWLLSKLLVWRNDRSKAGQKRG